MSIRGLVFGLFIMPNSSCRMSVPPPKPTTTRTIERIVLETFLVALAGAFALGVAWDIGNVEIGWIVAIVIWIVGAPVLEVLRVRSSR